jgi:glucose-1-phosphate adenylyltransferase
MARQDVLAIVLCGGRGTRLDPLTRSDTKPAVFIGGKYRLIDFSISNCINSDITCIFVLTQFLSASLHDHIQRTYQFDIFSSSSVQIQAAEQIIPAAIDTVRGQTAIASAKMAYQIYKENRHVSAIGTGIGRPRFAG